MRRFDGRGPVWLCAETGPNQVRELTALWVNMVFPLWISLIKLPCYSSTSSHVPGTRVRRCASRAYAIRQGRYQPAMPCAVRLQPHRPSPAAWGHCIKVTLLSGSRDQYRNICDFRWISVCGKARDIDPPRGISASKFDPPHLVVKTPSPRATKERQPGIICIERKGWIVPASWSSCGSSPTVVPSRRGGGQNWTPIGVTVECRLTPIREDRVAKLALTGRE